MDPSKFQETRRFDGRFQNQGGSQFIGNTFSGPTTFQQTLSSVDSSTPTNINDIPDLISPCFTGRSEELEQIRLALDKVSDNVPSRYAIYGIPGLGKTQLVLRYASLTFEENLYSYVFWISAATVEKVNRDFAKLADLIRLPGCQTLDQTAKIVAGRVWLEDDTVEARKWLMVLDDVNQETIASLRDILPRRNRAGNMLFTTRSEKVAEVLTTAFGERQTKTALKSLNVDEASALLLRVANLEGKQGGQDVLRFVNSIGRLPLTIDQAASFMKESGMSAQEMFNIYKSETVGEILDWENDLSRYQERSVAVTFSLVFERLKDTAPGALDLLRVLSFLDPESIPVYMLMRGSEAIQKEAARSSNSWEDRKLEQVTRLLQSPVQLQTAIQCLQKSSLVVQRSGESNRTLWIHDSVQLLLRQKLMTKLEQPQWLERVMKIMCQAFAQIEDLSSPKSWDECNQFATHVQSLEDYAEMFHIEDKSLINVSEEIAHCCLFSGRCQESESRLRRVYRRRKDVLGDKHPYTLYTLSILATNCSVLGRFKEAEDLGMQVMETWKRMLGPEHQETLRVMGILVSIYSKQGRLQEAENLVTQMIEIQKRVLGQEHPRTLSSIGNLAVIYGKQSRWKKAKGLETQILEIDKRLLGPEYWHVFHDMTKLAFVYSIQGRHKEAEELLVQVMELQNDFLGQENPVTLQSMSSLALVYKNQGRLKEAEELGSKALETAQKVFGQEHVITNFCEANLAVVYHDRGRKEEARQLMSKVMTIRTKTLGPDHPGNLQRASQLRVWNAENL